MSKELLVTGLVIAITGLIVWGALDTGRTQGKEACQAEQATANATAQTTAQTTANTQTKTAIKRATTAGQAQEKSRASVDQFFDQLTKETSHEQAAAPADTCSLSDARLRLWNYANTGVADSADSGAAAVQHDASTFAAATSSLGQAGGLGGQPPAGDSGLSPAGSTYVQSAGLAGDQP